VAAVTQAVVAVTQAVVAVTQAVVAVTRILPVLCSSWARRCAPPTLAPPTLFPRRLARASAGAPPALPLIRTSRSFRNLEKLKERLQSVMTSVSLEVPCGARARSLLRARRADAVRGSCRPRSSRRPGAAARAAAVRAPSRARAAAVRAPLGSLGARCGSQGAPAPGSGPARTLLAPASGGRGPPECREER
jgi:hypothetical protein